jgi:hypothetical protein
MNQCNCSTFACRLQMNDLQFEKEISATKGSGGGGELGTPLKRAQRCFPQQSECVQSIRIVERSEGTEVLMRLI